MHTICYQFIGHHARGSFRFVAWSVWENAIFDKNVFISFEHFCEAWLSFYFSLHFMCYLIRSNHVFSCNQAALRTLQSVCLSVCDTFLPEASFGLRVLSLPPCVRVSVSYELVCAITCHKFELKSPNLDQNMQNILLKVPIVLGTDWAWPSRSNFTLLKNYVYLHCFCIFEIFVRHVCLTAPHPTWLRTHCLTTTCPPTGSRSRLWNCLAVYLGETIGVQPASTRRLALNFTNSCWFSTYCTHLTCRNFICQHSAIVETTVKQLPLAFILCDCRCWKSPVSRRTALFLAP